MQLLDQVSDKFVQLTRNTPGFLHFDAVGFFRLAEQKNMMLERLNNLFHLVKEKGGNLLIPSYSYSYTKNEVYSLRDSASDLGRVSDYLRAQNPEIRTSDAIFPICPFVRIFPESFSPVSYESFGPASLISKVFHSDGYLMSVGDRLHYCTEVHFLEKLLKVSYRFNKDFSGVIKMLDGKTHEQVITYFCRDIEFSTKHNSAVSFERLFADMRSQGLIEEYIVEGMVEINAVKFQSVLSFLKIKLFLDPFYLMKDRGTNLPIGHGKS